MVVKSFGICTPRYLIILSVSLNVHVLCGFRLPGPAWLNKRSKKCRAKGAPLTTTPLKIYSVRQGPINFYSGGGGQYREFQTSDYLIIEAKLLENQIQIFPSNGIKNLFGVKNYSYRFPVATSHLTNEVKSSLSWICLCFTKPVKSGSIKSGTISSILFASVDVYSL